MKTTQACQACPSIRPLSPFSREKSENHDELALGLVSHLYNNGGHIMWITGLPEASPCFTTCLTVRVEPLSLSPLSTALAARRFTCPRGPPAGSVAKSFEESLKTCTGSEPGEHERRRAPESINGDQPKRRCVQPKENMYMQHASTSTTEKGVH